MPRELPPSGVDSPRAAGPRAAAGDGAGSRGAEGCGGVAGRRLQRGEGPEDERRQAGDSEGEADDPRVHARGRQLGQAEDRQGTHDPGAGHREERPDRPGDGGQPHAFGEQPAQEARPARAERAPHREFALPPGGPGEEQVGHVPADDEEHEQGDPEERDERLADAARRTLGERTKVHAHPFVQHLLDLALLAQPGDERRRFVLGLLDADPVPQPAHHAHEFEPDLSGLEVLGWLGRIRDIDLGRRNRKPEVRGHDPDDLETPVVEAEGLPQNPRIAPELPGPEGVREDDDGVAAGDRLLGTEGPADHRWDSQDLEEFRRHLLRGQGTGLSGRRRKSTVGDRAVAVHREAVEHRVGVPPAAEVVGRERRHLVRHRQAGTALPDLHQPSGLAVVRRLEQDAVDRREHRRGGADAEGERGDHQQDESRPLGEALQRFGEFMQHRGPAILPHAETLPGPTRSRPTQEHPEPAPPPPPPQPKRLGTPASAGTRRARAQRNRTAPPTPTAQTAWNAGLQPAPAARERSGTGSSHSPPQPKRLGTPACSRHPLRESAAEQDTPTHPHSKNGLGNLPPLTCRRRANGPETVSPRQEPGGRRAKAPVSGSRRPSVDSDSGPGVRLPPSGPRCPRCPWERSPRCSRRRPR